MTVVTITWEHTEEEKSSDPMCVDGAIKRDLAHINELAILFGKAASAFCEKDLEVHILVGGEEYFTSKEVGLKTNKPRVIN